MESEAFKQVFLKYQTLINDRLSKIADSRQPQNLYQPIEYVLNSGGKRIRPILLMLSCKALDGDVDASLDAAVAVELLHNFTLVHDDMMDQDDTRRGMPTVHKKWGSDIALLTGDGLVSLAYQSLLRTRSKRIHEISKIFTDGIIELCEGQALDYDFEKRQDVQLDDYLLMIGKKTARLLHICATIGAIIGNGSDSQVQALGNFGNNLGCAFQIQDDLLDITSKQEILGKTHGSDIIRKKQTYLVVYGLTHADVATKHRLLDILENSNNHSARITEIRDMFQHIGSIDAANAAIENYITSARANLDDLPSTPGKGHLLDLLDYVATRQA
ncbi:polyprenyl synthetase family protein [candidate division KSB1 bacterium]|nr:polyprenyl synthetase family protein [candidate division KSB1 bacterium]NIR69503.1 polyprenyl synthetase family protein [candidate division KSB1 bacterium]NIS24271.1 polyprenyl synthetase family protein [candidate division KSB1 bacterium]NIT71186.1 polyprenyl synthetase family protein [candidate division KSB1 bacterium]NIU24890.1 polyprenyl synthetase family protein [candidate division KSB1 bacterium]